MIVIKLLGCEYSNFIRIQHYFFCNGPIKLAESIKTSVVSLTTTAKLLKGFIIMEFLALSSERIP